MNAETWKHIRHMLGENPVTLLAVAFFGPSLVPHDPLASNSAVFGGMDLLAADEAVLADLRGREISMIFQSPRAALNPIRRVRRRPGQEPEGARCRRCAMSPSPTSRPPGWT